MKTTVVVQARMGSTRLPGKAMAPLAGAPLLERLLERVAAATTPLEIVVATTTDLADVDIRELCRWLGVRCVSGDPTDLLDRHLQAARETSADAVVKIPSDCPLIDPAAVDSVLLAFLTAPERYDYLSNLHPATWPDGNDVEVMTRDAIERAGREARRPHEREHTTPYLWDQPGRFRVGNVVWETGLDFSMSHRFTVDYPEDLAFVQEVYDALWRSDRPVFSTGEILAFLDRRPDVFALNARHAGVNWYRHHLGELRTVRAGETRHPEAVA
jgi:spore coat polysaccharide biosynthesis protein SpsF